MTVTVFRESEFDPMDVKSESFEGVTEITVKEDKIYIHQHGQIKCLQDSDITELTLRR